MQINFFSSINKSESSLDYWAVKSTGRQKKMMIQKQTDLEWGSKTGEIDLDPKLGEAKKSLIEKEK